jgi:hypothetical protein
MLFLRRGEGRLQMQQNSQIFEEYHEGKQRVWQHQFQG